MAKELTLEEKLKKLKEATSVVDKKMGKGTAFLLGTNPFPPVERIKTGSIALDEATGGGYPEGRIIEIYGPESSGKTTLALHAIVEAQKNDNIALFIDAEQAFDAKYAADLGVDMNKLVMSQESTAEKVFDIMETYISSGVVKLVVVDSVAALVPDAELNGGMEDQQMGLQARVISKGLRKISELANKNQTTIIFLNQIREKIGVMYGNPEITPGGKAMKFYCSIRIDIRRKEAIKNGSEVVGNKTHFKVVKNKTFPPFREADAEIYYGKGVDNEGAIIDVAVNRDIIVKTGGWYQMPLDIEGIKPNKFQGKEKVKDYLVNNPKEFEILKDIVINGRNDAMTNMGEPVDTE